MSYQSERKVKELKVIITGLIDDLYGDAKSLAESFWEEKKHRVANGEKGGMLGVRVSRSSVGTPDIRWFLSVPKKGRAAIGVTGRDKFYRKFLPKGLGYSYSLKTFGSAVEWEKDEVIALEGKGRDLGGFGEIRKEVSMLKEAERLISKVAKAREEREG